MFGHGNASNLESTIDYKRLGKKYCNISDYNLISLFDFLDVNPSINTREPARAFIPSISQNKGP